MTCSLAASRASELSLPPSEVQRLYMTAPAILGLRREYKRNERRELLIMLSSKAKKRDVVGRYTALRGNTELIENSWARTNDKLVAHGRFHLLPLGHVATHCHGIH